MQREVAIVKLSNKKLQEILEQGELNTDSCGSDIYFKDNQIELFVSVSSDNLSELHDADLRINGVENNFNDTQKKSALDYLVSQFEENITDDIEDDVDDDFKGDYYEYYGVSRSNFFNPAI